MRGFEWKTILAAAIAGSTLFLATGAQAHDDDDWRWRHRNFKHWHHGPERVVVERQPVYIERARPVLAVSSLRAQSRAPQAAACA